MSGLLVSLNLSDRPCLVVGGGEVAARKVSMLLRFACPVRVVSPRLHPELRERVEAGEAEWLPEKYQEAHLRDVALVVAATDDAETNRQVSRQAKERGLLVNVVDSPSLCTFMFPSILDRDPLRIAVSSGGVSPILARLIRARLETLVPAGYGRVAQLISRHRDAVRERFPDVRLRRRFWESLLQGTVESLVLAGRDEEAEELLRSKLQAEDPLVPEQGEVYLVGGGPGDPELLTFKALRLMQQADVVLYDRLVAAPILDLVRRDAERLYVGKKRDQHTMPQEDINQMLVRLAQQGKRVLRLKGGDPFIFGRGGEEISSLMEAGVSWQIVPGITAASGCASYAGIPLTHRDYAHSCLLITGHMKEERLTLNWDALLQPQQTVVVYMGTHGVEALARELLRRGMQPDWPAAVVERGTMREQRVHVSCLRDLPDMVKRERIAPPNLMILGEVVKLHPKLRWYNMD